VARYLSGRSIAESRLGLLFNGLLKVPMQFIILFIGVMVFVFYLFVKPPVYFNSADTDKILNTEQAENMVLLEEEHDRLFEERKGKIVELMTAMDSDDESRIAQLQSDIDGIEVRRREMKSEIAGMVKETDPYAADSDRDYIFITFVMNHLPHGLVGLLLAVIFSAAMSSSSSEINALASTSTVDIYKRSLAKGKSDSHYLGASRTSTLIWGLLAITFATLATKAENLIQFVNIVGSLFYGTVLGIFLTAFFLKKIKSNAVFIGALITQLIIFYLYFNDILAFLWYNLVGPLLVVCIAAIIQIVNNAMKK
jgi:Na+/proline symporter